MVAVSQISESDCFRVISKKLSSKNFKIVKYLQQGFDEIHGYLGEHSTLAIEIDCDGNRETYKFFVKSLPKVDSQRNFLLEINGFFKEAQFFTRFWPLLKENSIDVLDGILPCCYLVTEDSIIFEDLGMKGYKMLPSRVPLPLECVKAALQAFAKLYASGLILEEVKSFRLVDDFAEELKESFHLGTKATENGLNSCKQGIRALIDLTHAASKSKLSKEWFTTKALDGCELQKNLVKPSTRFRNTVCHADPWTKNFMFKFEEGRVNCVVVDFQTYRYGPPAQDVLSFIHMATDRKLRDACMGELLDFYYGQLEQSLGEFKGVVSRGEFFESCDFFKGFALTQTLMHLQVVILSDEIASQLFADPNKAHFVLFENKYDFFVECCHKDPVFRERNFEAIADLREFYECK